MQDDNFTENCLAFMKAPEGLAIWELTRKRLTILDDMCGKYNLDVTELTRVFDEAAEEESVFFRDHDLEVLDYLVKKIGNVPEIEQMRNLISEEVLLMDKIDKARGINIATA
jgi:hypothetical protein